MSFVPRTTAPPAQSGRARRVIGRLIGAFAIASSAVAIAACAEPLEFADWTLPVREGIPVHEYAPVPLEQRSAEIGLSCDLNLGGDPNDENQSFYRPTDIAVADDGRIFVFEWGNRRIQAFSAAGEHLATVGREGQGPGEIQQGGEIAVVGNRLVRSGDGKLSVWTLDGDHVADSMLMFAQSASRITALRDGWALGEYTKVNDDGTNTESVASISLTAEIGKIFAEITLPRPLQTITNESGFTIVSVPGPTPLFAASRDGMVYVTAAAEYQVHAFDADGEPRWALRTAWSRMPINDDDRERSVIRRVDDTPARNLDVEWPELNPALASVIGTSGGRALLADGHGHLYVFPHVRTAIDGRYPVDVYAPDGDRLFTGWIPVQEWRDALGDSVYFFRTREEDEETLAVRCRLEEPFE